MTSTPSETQAILDHRLNENGLIVAGPGTGKSTILLRLAASLVESAGRDAVRVVTFTRAATAELTAKIRDEGVELNEPTTLHAFALSLLMRNPGLSDLPEPLRIPSTWETKNLIQPDLANRLSADFDRVTVRTIDKLEREMAAAWESLDPERVMLNEIDPELRNAYVGEWHVHRQLFGYSLFAEMTLKAKEILEDHPDLDLHGLQLLMVDEYQDLNRCDIGMVSALASHGCAILAAGDDDQSIYSFRMAAPQGIWEFEDSFVGAFQYPLSVSYRCGSSILEAARNLIEASPGRPQRASLTAGPANASGTVAYLRFGNQRDEQIAVVKLIQHLIDVEGVGPNRIVVLVRGDHNQSWSKPIREGLLLGGVPAVDIEAAIEPLQTKAALQLIAVAHLISNPFDDLAWWTLCKLENGVSEPYVRAVADSAHSRGQRFSRRLGEVNGDPPPKVSAQAQRSACMLLTRINDLFDTLQSWFQPDLSEQGWTPSLIRIADSAGIELDEDFVDLLLAADEAMPGETFERFISQLEPTSRDLALLQPGVSIMSMMRSKGLTFDAALVLGVEKPVIPRAGQDEEEDRRLLYVAMTRARRFLFLTMATSRTGPTARAGGGFPVTTRSRCKFFSGATLVPQSGAKFIQLLSDDS